MELSKSSAHPQVGLLSSIALSYTKCTQGTQGTGQGFTSTDPNSNHVNMPTEQDTPSVAP
jgi:hypothetical protein